MWFFETGVIHLLDRKIPKQILSLYHRNMVYFLRGNTSSITNTLQTDNLNMLVVE